jgi:hypothetical protein
MNQPAQSAEQRLVALLTHHLGASSSSTAPSDDHLFVGMGEFNLSVMPAAKRPGWVLWEFELLDLDLSDPMSRLEPLRMLHRLNHAASGQHPWVISIDEDSSLVVTACVPTVNVLASDPIGFLSLGLSKAHQIVDLWRAADVQAAANTTTQPPIVPQAGYLRV